ncbi:MAG TPA: anti-sigma factor [Solirubrobacteraceae bacterium]
MTAGERDCGADAAAYVLGALEPSQADSFRRHLSGCAVCQDEVAAFGQVVDAVHLSAPQYRAPSGLRRRVMRAVRAEPRPAAARTSAQAARPRIPRLQRSAIPRRLALAMAMAALVVGAVELLSRGEQSSKVIHASVIGTAGSAEVRVAGGRAELILRGFPPPPVGDVYEVWLKRSGRAPSPTPVLFSVTSAGAGDVGVPADLHGVRQMLVTPEPAGGSLVPTHAPVIVAHLS